MVLEDKWLKELRSEYRLCLGNSNEEEAKEVLELIIIVLSNWGIGYPLLSKLKELKSETRSAYVIKKIDEIYGVWSNAVI